MRRTIKRIFDQLKNDLPSHIKSMRLEAELTQKELAAKLPSGISDSTVSNWEKGNGDIGFTNFIVICIACGHSPILFMGDVLDKNDLSYMENKRDQSD